jgi:hypothetical protein
VRQIQIQAEEKLQRLLGPKYLFDEWKRQRGVASELSAEVTVE